MAENGKEDLNIDLVVVESKIGLGGVARLHEETLAELGVTPGEHISVKSNDRSVLVKAFGDRIIDRGEISLRTKERKKLNVREGDYVLVSKYSSFGLSLGKRLGFGGK